MTCPGDISTFHKKSTTTSTLTGEVSQTENGVHVHQHIQVTGASSCCLLLASSVYLVNILRTSESCLLSLVN